MSIFSSHHNQQSALHALRYLGLVQGDTVGRVAIRHEQSLFERVLEFGLVYLQHLADQLQSIQIVDLHL